MIKSKKVITTAPGRGKSSYLRIIYNDEAITTTSGSEKSSYLRIRNIYEPNKAPILG